MAKGGKQKIKGGTGSAQDRRGGIAKAKEAASRQGGDTVGSGEAAKAGGGDAKGAKRDDDRGQGRR